MQAKYFHPAFMLLIAGLTLSTTVPARADETTDGVTRISDGRAPIPESQPVPAQGCINCQNGYGGGYLYDDGCRDRRPHSPVSVWLRGNGNTYSPDHGWAPPVKYPIRELPVSYYRYWPDRWYGEPGAGLPANAPRFPVVYTPSDTTQLGIYYQRVPTWQPNPAMIPPAPWPSVWHRRDCPNGNCNNVVYMQSAPADSQPTLGPSQPMLGPSEPTLALPPQAPVEAVPQAQPEAVPISPPAEESAMNAIGQTYEN